MTMTQQTRSGRQAPRCILLLLASALLLATYAGSEDTPQPQPDIIATGDLSPAEHDGLLLSWINAKFARDLLGEFHRCFGLPIFEGQHRIEQKRMGAFRRLLKKHRADTPTSEEVPGEFNDDDMRKRYRKMLGFGKRAQMNALKTAAEIRELEVIEFTRLLDQTDKPDVQKHYAAFLDGSRKQLRALYARIKRDKKEGQIYQPQHLPRQQFDAIIGSAR